MKDIINLFMIICDYTKINHNKLCQSKIAFTILYSNSLA